KKGILQQEAMKRGLLAGLFHGPSYAHKNKHIEKGLEIYDESLKAVKKYYQKGNIKKHLLGTYGGKVFRKVG
ncbi:hypothetical protein K8R33_04430, partial [archaeon]|nr:hypothetical protein [archaeon]